MSNNDLYCNTCKSQHHPAYCPGEEEETMTESKMVERIIKIIKESKVIGAMGIAQTLQKAGLIFRDEVKELDEKEAIKVFISAVKGIKRHKEQIKEIFDLANDSNVIPFAIKSGIAAICSQFSLQEIKYPDEIEILWPCSHCDPRGDDCDDCTKENENYKNIGKNEMLDLIKAMNSKG